MKKLKINLCENCAKELKNYNPYVDENGEIIPIEHIEINIVSQEKCDNYTVNGKFVNL